MEFKREKETSGRKGRDKGEEHRKGVKRAWD